LFVGGSGLESHIIYVQLFGLVGTVATVTRVMAVVVRFIFVLKSWICTCWIFIIKEVFNTLDILLKSLEVN